MSPVFFLTLRPPPSSTLFPYTTLFRSPGVREGLQRRRGEGHRRRTRQDLRCRHADRDRLLEGAERGEGPAEDRKSTRLNSSHVAISYAVFCLKKKKTNPRKT